MNLKLSAFIVVWICCATTGCGLIESAARTLVIEPVLYCACSDRYFSHRRHQQLAETAWQQTERAGPPGGYSPDYGFGFRTGFTDYLNAGPGNVPALPPRRYWKGKYQTPEGHQAILDWYAGFDHGVSVAAQSGYRQFVALPSFLPMSPTAVPSGFTPVAPLGPEVIPTPLPEPDSIEELRMDF